MGRKKGEREKVTDTEAGKRHDGGTGCWIKTQCVGTGAGRRVEGERRKKCQADLLFLLVFISCCSSEGVLLVRFYEPMPCYYSK